MQKDIVPLFERLFWIYIYIYILTIDFGNLILFLFVIPFVFELTFEGKFCSCLTTVVFKSLMQKVSKVIVKESHIGQEM